MKMHENLKIASLVKLFGKVHGSEDQLLHSLKRANVLHAVASAYKYTTCIIIHMFLSILHVLSYICFSEAFVHYIIKWIP